MAAVPLFPILQGLLDAVFDAQFFTRRNRVAAFNAKTGFDPAQLPFTLARDFQRRKFILNKLPAVGSFWFFHVSLSRPEFASAAMRSMDKLFGEAGVHAGNLCGSAVADNAISGAACALAGVTGSWERPDCKRSGEQPENG
jgi:hypothetical protein